jgi:predicted enzyme related to lactoylglutathione lyase
VPKRDEAPVGAPCWVDLFTSDPDRSQEFYNQLFGWTSQSAPEEFGGYINFSKDGTPIAGAMKNDGQSGTPDVWSLYLATTDAKATADAVAAHGGQVIVPAMEVGDLGSMAVFADAGGAAIGAWRPGQHRGFGLIAEAGAPTWFELHTRDYDASVRFYQDVFGWRTSVMSDTPEFRYSTLGEGDDALAGIMHDTELPEGVPAHWAIYFGVEDTDKTLERVVDLGGTVLMPAEDTPYGRLAVAADPTGATFRLVSV